MLLPGIHELQTTLYISSETQHFVCWQLSNFRLFVWSKYKWSLLFPSIWVFVCGTHFDSFLLRWHIFHVFFWLN